jgi:phage tail-like protein
MKKAEIKKLLPAVFRRTERSGEPLAAIFELMETMHAASESVLANIDTYFNPYSTPDAFVPYLATWVDLEMLLDISYTADGGRTASLSTGLGRLRELVASAVTMSHWRGTQKGLCLFLETATGASGFEVDERVTGADGNPKSFHVLVKAPGGMEKHRGLIERIVELEKPAYVTSDLVFKTPDNTTPQSSRDGINV